MANNIKIDPEKAITYGNQVVDNASDFKSEVNKIYSIVDDLNTTWTGTAASKFSDRINSFKEDYQKFGELITNFGELLTAIGKDYQNLEQNL